MLPDGSVCDRVTSPSDRLPLSRISVGIASLVAAGTAGLGAQAQEQAPASQQQLPPLEVTSDKPVAKKAKAKKKAASSSAAVSPVPQGPSEPAAAAAVDVDPTDSFTPASGNTLQSGTGLGRLPGTYQDMPQTVNVISQERIQQQNLTTIDQALRSVPGVTVSIGEGNGGMNGDQFRIRGFDAKGDLYVDGLRDFGVYVRDGFAYEQIDVLMGPSSESFGMGTTGGAINLRQKTAHRGNSYSFEASVGTDSMFRSVIDVNQQINATTAARAVGMYHNQDIADRDHVYSDRWGFLGSLAFGLGTDTTLTVNYMHQDTDRKPDYGVPFLRAPGTTVGLPSTEFGIPRSNYYGKESDRDESTVDMLTARLSTKVNDWLTVNNDTRLEFFKRDISTTPATCTEAPCNDVFFATGDAPYTFGAGGGSSYAQDSWGIQNITTAIAKFHTGGLRHEFVAGVDAFYQDDSRLAKSYVTPKVPGTLLNPNYAGTGLVDNPNNQKRSDGTDIGLFASERLWLTPEFSLLGGIRWDSYTANYTYTQSAAAPPTTGACIGYAQGTWCPERHSKTEFWSPKLSAIWEPTKQETYYVSWATSATPAGQFIVSGVNPIGTTPGQENLKPEENETYEAGAKWSLLGGKLGVTAAIFRVDKSNAYYTDPSTGNAVPTGEKQRVQGVELGVNGKLTDKWSLAVAYAYLDSKITYATGNGAGNIGNHVPGVPENSASLWTTYDIASLVNVPGQLLVGGGITYAQEMYIRSDQLTKIPHSFALDGLISYEVDGYRVALNGYNLTNELYYDTFFQGENAFTSRATPAAGRTGILTIGKKF